MCIHSQALQVEFVEGLEAEAASWSRRQWDRAAYLCSQILRQVIRDGLMSLPLLPIYSAVTPTGRIAVSIVETRDRVCLRVYDISFTTGTFEPDRHLPRTLGRSFVRESFFVFGIGRTRELIPVVRIPWRHIRRNEIGANTICTISIESIEFASSISFANEYLAGATTASEDAKYWMPNGSHDSSLGRLHRDAHLDNPIIDRPIVDHFSATYFARSQPSYSLGDPAHAKGSDKFDGDIEDHEDFKGDDDVVDEVGDYIPMPARTCMFDTSALETAQFAPPSRMHTLTSALHTAERNHGPGHPPPRPHGSPRSH